MPIYTVHAPPPRKDESAADPERFAFVRDGFHFWAFLLAPLWMLLAPAVAGAAALRCRHRRRHGRRCALLGVVRRGEIRWSALLIALLVGFEAATLRRWTLRGAAGAISASWSAEDLEDAERRFFDDWVDARERAAGRAASRSRRSPRRRAPPAQPTSIGLFPAAGRRRDERRDRRLRLGQSALGREGLRARRARERARPADRGDQRSRHGARAPTAWCCPASAPSPIAGAGSTRCPAWSRR